MEKDMFEDLYSKNYKFAYLLVYSRIKNKEIASDILQDSFISVYKNFDKIQDEMHFSKLLNVTIINKTTDYFRKKKDTLFSDNCDDELNPEEFIEDNQHIEINPEKMFEYSELKNNLFKIIDSLPEGQKTCILLYYYEQYTIDEIANILGINQNTVKSRLLYAKKRIKAEIESLKEKGTHIFSITPPFIFFDYFKTQSQDITIPKFSNDLIGSRILQSATSSLKKTNSISNTTKSSLLHLAKIGIVTVTVTTMGYMTIVKEPISQSNNEQVTVENNETNYETLDQSSVLSLLTEGSDRNNDEFIIEKTMNTYINSYYSSSYLNVFNESSDAYEEDELEHIPDYTMDFGGPKYTDYILTKLLVQDELEVYKVEKKGLTECMYFFTVYRDGKYWLVRNAYFTVDGIDNYSYLLEEDTKFLFTNYISIYDSKTGISYEYNYYENKLNKPYEIELENNK